MSQEPRLADLVVIGAGAAGLASAIFTARAARNARVVCVDGARTIGAKILVSGGSRCNVSNRVVDERDFWGGSRRVVRRVLRAFPAARAAAFFEALGVALHEEEDGKLFPDTNRSRTVLDALLREASQLGVVIETGQRVCELLPRRGGFSIVTGTGSRLTARAVVMATGGKSLPKSGSDGFGYELAARLGHGHVPTTPALAPLVLEGKAPRVEGAGNGADGERASWRRLAGVAHPAALSLRTSAGIAVRVEGAMLWTHFGISGPVALNMSRHWHRAALEARSPLVSLNVLPGETFESLEAWLLEQDRQRPRAQVATVLSARLPAAVADAWCASAGLAPGETMAHLPREYRRQLIRALVDTPLPVIGSRGYAYAEVTAGGVPLDEIDPATMESRVTPGLYLAGEILDVDGRLGGFNFQWAWSSAFVAGQAIARAIAGASGTDAAPLE